MLFQIHWTFCPTDFLNHKAGEPALTVIFLICFKSHTSPQRDKNAPEKTHGSSPRDPDPALPAALCVRSLCYGEMEAATRGGPQCRWRWGVISLAPSWGHGQSRCTWPSTLRLPGVSGSVPRRPENRASQGAPTMSADSGRPHQVTHSQPRRSDTNQYCRNDHPLSGPTVEVSRNPECPESLKLDVGGRGGLPGAGCRPQERGCRQALPGHILQGVPGTAMRPTRWDERGKGKPPGASV